VRKFFCDQPTCPRQLFTERLLTVAAPWARRTLRLAQRLRACGLALGGEMGARLGHRLGLPTSPDTLLRLVQEAPTPAATAPQVLSSWTKEFIHFIILLLIDTPTGKPLLAATFSNKPR